MREQGALWTETGRVFFQPRLLSRDSPVAGDINRGERKLHFSKKRERGEKGVRNEESRPH